MKWIAKLLWLSVLVTCAVRVGATELQASDGPKVFWSSDPALPDETVLLAGGGFTDEVMVQIGRLRDGVRMSSCFGTH